MKASPIALSSGDTVYYGDVVTLTPAASAGYYFQLYSNGTNYGYFTGTKDITIHSDTEVETTAGAIS